MNSKKIRIFAGIKTAESINKELIFYLNSLNQSKLKILPKEKYHITLAPPLYAEDNKIKEVISTIANIAQNFSPFKINLFKIGPSLNNKMIWGYFDHKEELFLIQIMIAKKLNIFDYHDYLPHVTIAKSSHKITLNPIARNSPQIVDKITVYQSTLTSTGSEYKVIKELPLQKITARKDPGR